ncbi:transmembrane protein 223-like [Xenia sp. Carnegie-2017]|uniref:transmembrane protein 223-like n=1 Tax=Xenia sp. Carnegie-2017 TaxID=2897299 RepID=UPI001F049730|nr:transmembrane protein 223-like [Xenia sp. Carnegie-2017]
MFVNFLLKANSSISTATFFKTQRKWIDIISKTLPIRRKVHNSSMIFKRLLSTRYNQDILLFEYDRRSFFKILGLATLSQLVFWSYMSYVMYAYVRPASQVLRERSSSKQIKEYSYFPTILLHPKVQMGMSIASMGLGLFFFFAGRMYAKRSVHQLILLRNGAQLIVRTHTLYGGTQEICVPLTDVSCFGSRFDTSPFVILKMRNHSYYFMLDKRGDFLQSTLFDTNVGVKRWS